MVYFFHHYEIPAIIQQGTVHNITATVNIHEHQRAPQRRADQEDRQHRSPHQGELQTDTTGAAPETESGVGAAAGVTEDSISVQETGDARTDTEMVSHSNSAPHQLLLSKL